MLGFGYAYIASPWIFWFLSIVEEFNEGIVIATTRAAQDAHIAGRV